MLPGGCWRGACIGAEAMFCASCRGGTPGNAGAAGGWTIDRLDAFFTFGGFGAFCGFEATGGTRQRSDPRLSIRRQYQERRRLMIMLDPQHLTIRLRI